MASKPIMSLGLDIPNCTMSIPPDSENGLAAGWAQSGGLGTWSMYGEAVAGRRGHDRVQYFSLTTANAAAPLIIMSGPSSPRLMCAAASTLFYPVMVYGVVGAGAQYIAVYLDLLFYNAAGTLVQTSQLASISTGAAVTFGLYTGDALAALTPPATAYQCKLRVTITKSNSTGSAFVSFAFVNVGVWDGATTRNWQWSRYPSIQGTGAWPMSQARRNDMGKIIDRNRHGHPFKFTFATDAMSAADGIAFERTWRCNTGRSAELSSATNPTGGSYPILLIPGRTDMPLAALVDFDEVGEYPLRQTSPIIDSPLWSGVMNFSERL